MSPDKGRRGTSGKGGSDTTRGPAATRRLGLAAFGAAFLILFLIVAISEGIGDPSIPSGDVALVQDVPGDIGEVSQERFDHTLELTAAQAGEKKAPKPGDPKYEEVKEAALKSIFEAIWLQGVADEWGIEVTDAEIAKQLKKTKEESFKTVAEFQKFLKESHYTPADVNERVKLQIISEQLQEELKEKVPTPSSQEITDYYEAAKATQFTEKPSRDVRTIVNKDSKKVDEAKQALAKDNTEANWKKIAKEFSEDPSTKESGGLQKGVPEGLLGEPLEKPLFAAPKGQIEGPVKTQRGYILFEVVNSTLESVQELKAVESQIQSTLAQRLEQEYFAGFARDFIGKWTQRTFCAPDYLVERCANFKNSAHPSTAPAGCYEADPKGGRPDACPAPVFQAIPALPGTVTPLEPQGKPLAQRPQPLGLEESAAAEAPGGIPGGGVPPTEVPSE